MEITGEDKTFVLNCSIRYKARQEGSLWWGLTSMDNGAGTPGIHFAFPGRRTGQATSPHLAVRDFFVFLCDSRSESSLIIALIAHYIVDAELYSKFEVPFSDLFHFDASLPLCLAMGDTVGLQVGVSKNQSYIDSLLMFEIALVYSVSYPYVPTGARFLPSAMRKCCKSFEWVLQQFSGTPQNALAKSAVAILTDQGDPKQAQAEDRRIFLCGTLGSKAHSPMFRR